jgi:hypothetical protein
LDNRDYTYRIQKGNQILSVKRGYCGTSEIESRPQIGELFAKYRELPGSMKCGYGNLCFQQVHWLFMEISGFGCFYLF